MAAALPYSRSLSQQLWAKATGSFTRPGRYNSLLRVSCTCSANNQYHTLRNSDSSLINRFKQARTYATAAAKSTRKPKVATRRTAGAKKATPKKPVAKKAVRKPKKKAVKKTKPKKPIVKKAPSKTALAQKARTARVELRSAALLEKPKQLPSTAYTVLLVTESKGSKGNVTAAASSISAKYRNLSPEEREVRMHNAVATRPF